MNKWQPDKTAIVVVEGNKVTIGNDGYRFYTQDSKGEWDSCLEYKHDCNPLAYPLACAMWNAITANMVISTSAHDQGGAKA
jgi:hypothetical protein